jgi:hypothetical protein
LSVIFKSASGFPQLVENLLHGCFTTWEVPKTSSACIVILHCIGKKIHWQETENHSLKLQGYLYKPITANSIFMISSFFRSVVHICGPTLSINLFPR